MEVLLLKNDGRCVWLENKVLKGFMPMAIRNSVNPFAKKIYVIVDWISNDYGRVGVDLKWFRSLGVPAVASAKELPHNKEFKVVNTGYDSIVEEEIILRDKGVEIIDKPCPFVRRVRDLLEQHDETFQIILLCEPNHIIVKNFASLFPQDLLLVQMENYREKLLERHAGKPLKLIPYVTFLQTDAAEITEFIEKNFPHPQNQCINTACIWVKSKASPIIEIDGLSSEQLSGVRDALLISTAGTTNKSVVSMEKSLQKRGLNVVPIGSFSAFLRYKRQHPHDRVLVVRSPIPNRAEQPIMTYLEKGLCAALLACIKQQPWVLSLAVRLWKAKLALHYRLFRKQAYAEAAEQNLLKTQYQTPASAVRYAQPASHHQTKP